MPDKFSPFIFAVLLGVILPSMSMAADESLLLDNQVSRINPTSYLRILEDPAGNWNITEAVERFINDSSFSVDESVANFGLSQSAYWVGLTVTSSSTETLTWYVEIDYPILDRVDLYIPEGPGNFSLHSGGDTLPFTERDVNFRTLVFPFSLAPGETNTLYFRIISQGSVQFPMTLWAPESFNSAARSSSLGLGLYYGIMLALILYNLFVFVSVRDRSYLYYVLYVTSVTLYQLSNHGLALQFLWPTAPAVSTASVTSFAALAALFGLLFCRSYLQVGQFSVRINRVLQGQIIMMTLVALSPLLFGYKIAAIVTPVSSIVVAFTIFAIGSLFLLKGYRPARFFMTAWVVFLIAVIMVSMQRYGLIDSNFFTQNGVLIGTAVEVVLLSLGLADRINILTQEKEEFQQKLLRNNALTIEALEQADAIKDEFVANVSHELRTPLTGIIGLTDLVMTNNSDKLDARDINNLSMIRSSGQRLTTLVNDIIDISAINRDHIELNRKPVDLPTIANMVITMCEPLVGEKPVALKLETEQDIPMALADEDRLQQILFNLISNAVKFTFSGSVTVRVETLDGAAKVSITDTGIGIKEEMQDAIFSPFKQGDASTQREFGGSGLGLSITRKLLQLHDSDISLSSQAGQGSCFAFTLKLTDELPQTAPEQRQLHSGLLPDAPGPVALQPDDGSQSESETAKHTILLVDDEYVNLHVLQEYLQPRYRLLLAQDGFQALEILQHETPHLILLDLMMPRMNGYEVCQRIREHQTLADLPIIILTAKNQVRDLVTGLQSGANDYLSKPFYKEELLVRVDKQIQLRELVATREQNIRLQEQVKHYREAEEKLHISQERLARMLDISSDPLLTVNEGGEIIFVNQTAATLLGCQASALLNKSIETIMAARESKHPLQFPFNQQYISEHENPLYFSCALIGEKKTDSEQQLKVCILTLTLEQEFYVIILSGGEKTAGKPATPEPHRHAMPQLIEEVNRNARRAQLLSDLLLQLTADELGSNRHLLDQLGQIDHIIDSISASVQVDDRELRFRQVLVNIMQEALQIWQRLTHRSVIDLAEESRVWRVSIDNGRLRARSLERYLDITKLPKNPRWREVTRTAYFILGNLEVSAAEKSSLEAKLSDLQEFVRF